MEKLFTEAFKLKVADSVRVDVVLLFANMNMTTVSRQTRRFIASDVTFKEETQYVMQVCRCYVTSKLNGNRMTIWLKIRALRGM